MTAVWGDPADLARRIVELHDDPLRLERLSRNASRTFARFFVAEEVYPKMVRFLEQIAVDGAIHEPAENLAI